MPTDCDPGSRWLRGYDHQSAAGLFALPSFFDTCEGDAFFYDKLSPSITASFNLPSRTDSKSLLNLESGS
jgi:hypothetical protein